MRFQPLTCVPRFTENQSIRKRFQAWHCSKLLSEVFEDECSGERTEIWSLPSHTVQQQSSSSHRDTIFSKMWKQLDSIDRAISKPIFALRYFYGPVTVALGPIAGVSLLAVSPLSTLARQMGYFQICAWSTGVLPTAILKPLVGRERPASWILNGDDSRLHHAATEKHIPALPRLFAKDSYESMPSGDAAGAVGCMYLFLRSENSLLRTFGILCIALSCFGRMYWMAHHFLDVCVGVLTSLVACTMLQTRFCNGDATECFVEWWNPIAIHAFVFFVAVAPKWYKKKPTLYAGTLRMDINVENELMQALKQGTKHVRLKSAMASAPTRYVVPYNDPPTSISY
eukprot:scaffold22653_cov119-Cylindrotheca_fusiformis.AAC.5